MASPHIDTERHPIDDNAYIEVCQERVGRDGALVLPGFVRAESIAEVVDQVAGLEPPRSLDELSAPHRRARPSSTIESI